LEGVVKHNGPLLGKGKNRPLPRAISEYNAEQDLQLNTYASAEAQVASLSDDVAYNNHDIDDGLRAGLFTVCDLEGVPLVGPIFAEVRKEYPRLDESRRIHEAVRRLIGTMVHDLLRETRKRLEEFNVDGVDTVRRLDQPVAAFSAEMQTHVRAVKDFLFTNMYRHEHVNRMTAEARRVVRNLFKVMLENPKHLPDDWRRNAESGGTVATAQVIADYVAGMTDRFALDQHQRLCGPKSRTA
jgi:dGTPase